MGLRGLSGFLETVSEIFPVAAGPHLVSYTQRRHYVAWNYASTSTSAMKENVRVCADSSESLAQLSSIRQQPFRPVIFSRELNPPEPRLVCG
jgi:hypothetical protein